MIYKKNITYGFCIVDIVDLKKKFQHKICFKKKHLFLKLKNSPTQSLTNRLTKKGNFLKVYKVLKKFYFQYILQKKFQSISLSSNFLFFFFKYNSFKDFDRVLLWKYNQLDCMFSFKAKKVKKKKNKLDFLFITGIKRVLMCINIIKYLVLIKKKIKNNLCVF